jgi:hypothetical protein
VTPEVATARVAPQFLQEHVRKTHETYEHARLAQEGLLFSAWVNGQREIAESRARRRRMQVTWALLGGPPGRRQATGEEA